MIDRVRSVSTRLKIERIGGATLYLGDCLDVLPTLGRVDAVVTDPPYERLMHDLHARTRLRRTDAGPARRRLTFGGIEGETRDRFLAEADRLCLGWLLVFCNVEGVWHWREAITSVSGLKFKTTCIWVKPDALPKLNGQGPALAYECFTTTWCGRGHSRWNAGGKRGVYVHATNGRERTGTHPAEKPAALMREMIDDFVPPGGVVLDPFMGSGTTGVACLQTGRRFVGVEVDEAYFDAALGRIRAEAGRGDFVRGGRGMSGRQIKLMR